MFFILNFKRNGDARVTYGFHYMMEGASKFKTSEFSDEIIKICKPNERI